MQVVVKIFGRTDSKRADMQCVFNIHEMFNNGKWSYKMSKTTFRFFNDPIDEVDKTALQVIIMQKIEELLNSSSGRRFVSSPILRIYYDDADKRPVVKFNK